MSIIFRGAGYLTLLIDAYLLLAMVAISRMKAEYHQWLPPFGYEFAASMPRIVYIWLVAWTGFLALGCLYATKRRDQPEKS
jgi:hypothetical protein